MTGGDVVAAGADARRYSRWRSGKMMMLGYSPVCFVCRDGFLGIYLSEKERGDLDTQASES
jgi:hypothetical protein